MQRRWFLSFLNFFNLLDNFGFFDFFEVLNLCKFSIKSNLLFISFEGRDYKFIQELFLFFQDLMKIILILLEVGFELVFTKVELLVLAAVGEAFVDFLIVLVENLCVESLYLATISVHFLIESLD